MAKLPRASVGTFMMHFGPVSVQGRLYPISKGRKSDVKLCTPDGRPVQQVYRSEDGEIWEKDALGRARVGENDELIPIDPEALEEAKTSQLPEGVLQLAAHRRAEVESAMWHDDSNSYVFLPIVKNSSGKEIKNPANQKWHDLLTVMVRESPDVIFLGRCHIFKSEHLYELRLYQGHLAVVRLKFPEQLYQYDVVHPELSVAERERSLAVVQAMVTPFDADEYADNIREAVAAALEADYEPGSVERAAAPESFDVVSALDAFLG